MRNEDIAAQQIYKLLVHVGNYKITFGTGIIKYLQNGEIQFFADNVECYITKNFKI
jgi:hypothetical protein